MFSSTELARAIRDTAAERENSWSDKAKYNYTITESARLVCSTKPGLLELVVLLLNDSVWNDSLAWAEKELNG